MSHDLNKLYQTLENSKELGISNEELIEKANKLEEELIKEEILPVLIETITPALQQVKRELVLVVDYVPGQPISVHLSRRRNFTSEIPDAKEIILDPKVAHTNWRRHVVEGAKRGPASNMSVKFPDGTIIEENSAAETMFKVVQKIGVTKVRNVVETYHLKFSKVPVVSNRRDEKYGRSQKDLGDGWFLITHSNNEKKKAFIQQVSDVLGLDLEVILK